MLYGLFNACREQSEKENSSTITSSIYSEGLINEEHGPRFPQSLRSVKILRASLEPSYDGSLVAKVFPRAFVSNVALETHAHLRVIQMSDPGHS